MIQQVMIMNPCRAWKSPLLLLSPLYWAAGLSVCVLFHPFESMACEWDKKNNLVQCEDQSCATRGQVTENKAPFRLLEKLPKDMFVLILRFLNSKDHIEARTDSVEALNIVFSTKKTEMTAFMRASLRPLLKEKNLQLCFNFVHFLKSEELFKAVSPHLPRNPAGKVKENPFVQSLAITAGGIDPEWSSRFPNLRQLFLYNGPTHNTVVEFLNGLEAFHQLKVLSLDRIRIGRTSSPFTSPFFESIRTLHFKWIPIEYDTQNTLEWLFVALPNLEDFKVEGRIDHPFPIDLRLIPKLKKLYLAKQYNPVYTVNEEEEDKTEKLPDLREAVIEDLFFTSYGDQQLDTEKKVKIEIILHLLNQAPSLRTLFPQTDVLFQWKMAHEGPFLSFSYDGNLSRDQSYRLIPVSGIEGIAQILEPYLNKEWAQSLWSLTLAANGNWEKAIQHALALQSQGNEEATRWLIEVMLKYARDVNPSSVSPHFQAFLQQGRKLYRHPFSIDQERDWQAKWIAYIAVYTPTKALLDSQEEKELTPEEAEKIRQILSISEQNIPPSIDQSRIQKKKDHLQDASQRVEHIISDPDPLQWTQLWTLALNHLLYSAGQNGPDFKEPPSPGEERLILLLIKELKRSFSDPHLVDKDSSLFLRLFYFYLHRNDSKEALFWLKHFIDHSNEYSLNGEPQRAVFYPALLSILEQDPVYSHRFTDWIEPLLTRHSRKEIKLNELKKDFLPALQEHYQKRFKQEGMDQGDAEEKAEVEAETKAEARIYRIEPKYEKPALSLEISPIPQNNAAPNINEVLNINAVSNINALPNINAVPDSQEGQDKPELKMSDSFAEEL